MCWQGLWAAGYELQCPSLPLLTTGDLTCALNLCVQAATAEALADLEVHGISTPPKQRLDAAELSAAAADPAAAEALYDRLREASGGIESAMSIVQTYAVRCSAAHCLRPGSLLATERTGSWASLAHLSLPPDNLLCSCGSSRSA